MIGVAVGLGNVWRFPYMMGQYGGSTFILIYLCFVLFLAIPALTGEWALGRFTRMGPYGAFTRAFNPIVGKVLATLLVLAILTANSYYIVIIGHIIYSTFHSAFFSFSNESYTLSDGLNNHYLMLGVSEGILMVSLLIIYSGLRKGIERISIIFVPFFALVMLYLLYYTLSIPGATDHLREFLKPDFSNVTAKNVFAAMGQAFFSLSLGGTILVVYGSYLKDRENLPKMAVATGMGDLLAALLVSLFIVPTVMLFGLQMDEGYTLLFSTLPVIFQKLAAGRLLGTLFLLSLSFMAFLSNIGALVVVSRTLELNTKLGSKSALYIIGGALFLLIIPSSLFPQIIPKLDLIAGSGMQVFGSAIALIAITWGFGKMVVYTQIFPSKQGWFQSIYYLWMKWIIPLALFATLAFYIVEHFKG